LGGVCKRPTLCMKGRKMSNQTTTKKKAPAKEKPVSEEKVVETVVQEVAEHKEIFVPKEIDLNQIITVRNGFQGELNYKSKRTGERWKWDEFGAEQDMELSELKSARNSNKKYFINNWFMFDDEWVVDYLGVSQFYKHAVKIDDFDKLFSMSPSQLEATIEPMSAGQKKSVSYRAKQLIASGDIDSNKVIATLEKCLGVELVER